MENNKNIYKFLFKNEEKRTEIIKDMEVRLNEIIQGIESTWKLTGQIEKTPQKYNEYSQNVMKELQKLNDELKKYSEMNSDAYKKDVKFLLNLEGENYKTTLTIFINKLNCFDMIKNDEDEYKLIKKEKEISELKETLADIREQINDFITNLKYKYLN